MRRFGLPLFVLTILGSAGFTACSSLKSAPVAEDAALPPGSDPGVSDGTTPDANDPRDGDANVDADLDASDPRYASCSTVGAVCSCQSFGFEIDSSSCLVRLPMITSASRLRAWMSVEMREPIMSRAEETSCPRSRN